MSMGVMYRGGFYGMDGRLWDVEILKEGYTSVATEVAFGSEPLTIEWAEVGKLEPVMSSSARLQLFSDTDREFVGLYTVEAGSVRLDVSRDGSLYWSGTIDTELYEEPYSYLDGYTVEVAFSDFAYLDRLGYDGEGFVTLRDLIGGILERSGVRYGELVAYVSTAPYLLNVADESSGSLLDTVSVQAANFYDEDGEAMTLREALDETLRPLALQLRQKDGRVYLYDLNALMTATDASPIGWARDDATLSVDRVYNNVRVSYSPYERTLLLRDGIGRDDVPQGDEKTVYVTQKSGGDEIGFRIRRGESAYKGVTKHAKASYFAIESVYSGSDSAGILWRSDRWTGGLNEATAAQEAMLFRPTKGAYVGDAAGGHDQLRISLDLCVDTRYNPFEEADGDNGKRDYEKLCNWANFTYVPVRILLKDENGRTLCHYFNKGVKLSNGYGHGEGRAKWMDGEGRWGDCWLCYYDGNRKNETGLGGWKTNKPMIGYYRGELPTGLTRKGDGELIPLPPRAGWLEVEVGVGIDCYDYDSKTSWKLREDLYPLLRWMLYRNLRVEVVDRYGRAKEGEDIEINARLHRAAKEQLTIETKIGTLDKGSATALGQYFATSTKQALSRFRRGGRTDRLEKLLCGTVYSQHAGRKTVLKGEAELLPAFGTYSETNEGGRYVALGEAQDLRAGTEELIAARIEADCYEAADDDITN